jgi:hypothetical protein
VTDAPADAPGKGARRQSLWARYSTLLSKVALELFIVFVGVSAAFAVDNYRDSREQDARRQAVYRALDRELKQMAETHGPMLHRVISAQLDAWDEAVARGEKPLPPAFRIPDAERPPTGVWNAAVASGTIELIDPELMFELARFYTRAESAGDLYQRYSAAGQVYVWPHLDEGPSAFWEPNGHLREQAAAHVQRLRDFAAQQGRLSEEAKVLRARLRMAAEH